MRTFSGALGKMRLICWIYNIVVLCANGQLIPGFGLLPSSIQNTVVSTVKNKVQSATGIDTTTYVSDDVLVSILSDPKTTDPMSWDAEFLTPIVANVPNGDQIVAYTELAQVRNIRLYTD